MKFKYFFTLLLFIVQIITGYLGFFIPIYFHRTPAIVIFVLTGIVSLIFGIASIRRYRAIGILCIILGIFSVGVIMVLVLSSISSEPKKSPNTAIKANLANLRGEADQIYTSTKSYDSVCSHEETGKILNVVKQISNDVKCFSNKEGFVVIARFKKEENNETHWCVDSTGKQGYLSKEKVKFITSASTLCPQ